MPRRSGQGRQHDQGPAPRPVCVRLAVDALRGFGKALASDAREPILAQLADAPRLHPAFVSESRRGGANQALVEAKGRRELDQAAERNRAAARHERIPENRHDQRSGPKRALFAQALDEIAGGGGAVGGSQWNRSMQQFMTQKKLI